MSLKVCKFGGTSMADANAIRAVAEIIRSQPERKYIVVSAPGKRFKNDVKITDTLYKCYEEVKSTGSCQWEFSVIRERFTEIVKELGIDFDIDSVLKETEEEINGEKSSPDFAASRGEYLSARILAAYLGFDFIDAADIIRFDSKGVFNQSYTDDKIQSRLSSVEYAVIPGFYGKDSLGKIKTFSRGGSDITGSIIAGAINADIYENWTDVSGFMVCDPRIVPETKIIKHLSYKELRELSYMGASVLHAEAIFPVMRKKIPINIRNTFRPEDEGTLIVPSEYYNGIKSEIITGIAGKKNFTVIFVEKSLMNSEVGFVRKVLSIIENHGVCIEHIPSGIDTLSVVIESDYIKNGILDEIVNEIRESVNPDYVRVIENISLIATVGHSMANRSGVAARLFGALANQNISIRMIDQGSSELNIIIGVSNDDYGKCIKAIYDEFVNN